MEGGLNQYAYAGGNPVSNVDPSGLDFKQLDNAGLSNSFNHNLNNQIMMNQQRGFDPLGALFPRTMSNFSQNKNYAAALNQSANIRNITSAGAITAFSPYVSPLAYGGGALGYSAGSLGYGLALNGIRTFTAPQVVGNYSLGRSVLLGAGASSGIDAIFQLRDGANFSNFNYQRNLGIAAVGGLTGGWNTGRI